MDKAQKDPTLEADIKAFLAEPGPEPKRGLKRQEIYQRNINENDPHRFNQQPSPRDHQDSQG